MNKIIIPTGYMGSGSSAITDLIGEFVGYEAPQGDFEYVFLHCPNGLFDLEDKLITGNNALRSDEALRTFRSAMYELHGNHLWWPSNYKKRLSPRFMEITDSFIDNLTQFQTSTFWYHQEQRGLRALPKLVFNKAIRTLTRNRIAPRKPLRYRGMRFSLPSPEEFYASARDYLAHIWDEIGLREHNLILDQLVLPFNLWRLENYFPDNAICIVVERDPRDLFLINKYILDKRDSIPVPYPTDVSEFCRYYRRIRQLERPTASAHVYRIMFEDLVYNYDETVSGIMGKLGLSWKDNPNPRSRFDPRRSINNTQIFLQSSYQEEREVIERELPEFLYKFPYPISHQEALIF